MDRRRYQDRYPIASICVSIRFTGTAMSFIHDDFLLSTNTARRLYRQFAEGEPILDYHCHLPPKDVAENRRFQNLFEIWLEGDHYKWRAMRANGVAEKYCTGGANPREKFLAWARTVPSTLRNPLYHWTHLELKRYFGIDELLDERSAPGIWDQANALLATDELSARGILGKFRVKAVCTTDDPTDDLAWHKSIAASGLETKVFPTFRPDKALNVHAPEVLNAWVEKLEAASGVSICKLADFVDALKKRHDFFHAMGGRLSDHGLNHAYANFPTEHQAAAIFGRARGGHAATHEEHCQFASYMMLAFGRFDAEKGWTKQMHLGARRNNNTRGFRELGADVGFDSIGDWPQADAMGNYLDRLDQDNALPKIVIYNLNPADELRHGDHDRKFPGWGNRRQNPTGQRLVVSGSEGGHAVADECTLQLRADFTFPRNADGFAVVHVLPAARVLSQGAVRHAGERHRGWGNAR